jgi:hypothetical protein
MLEQSKAMDAEMAILNAEYIELVKRRRIREAAAKKAEALKPKSIKRKKQYEELESLHKEVKQTKIPNLSSLKRKHQLAEMEMLKKEIENSKIPDIKIDSCIEGMIQKLDALTKSNTLKNLKKI